MGTSNFSKTNANHYYVVDCEDTWEYEDNIDNVRYELANIDDVHVNFYENSHDFDDVAIISNSFSYGEFDVDVSLNLKLEPGYYQGANYDYDITVSINGDDYDLECLDLFDALQMNSYETSDDELKIMATMVKALLEVKLEGLVDKVENVLKENTEVYDVSARFSNGETIYSKVV